MPDWFGFPQFFRLRFTLIFGCILARIWPRFWSHCGHSYIILASFFRPSNLYGFSLNFDGFLGPWNHGKSNFTWYSRKNKRNRTFRFYIDFVSPFGHILAWFSEPFSMIFHIFRAPTFGRIFGCVFLSFWHQTGSQMAPKIDQEIPKKRKCCPPFQQRPPGLCFDPILDPFWSPFGTFWASSGHHLGAFWHESSIRNHR